VLRATVGIGGWLSDLQVNLAWNKRPVAGLSAKPESQVTTGFILVSKLANGTVLFAGYGRNRTRLHDEIEATGRRVVHVENPIADLSGFDNVISFGYRHLLSPALLDTARRPVVNLHISYLPYNRGAHPAVWALLEDTPLGVTIHEIDQGIDTGPIIVQQRVDLESLNVSFNAVRALLVAKIEALFLRHMTAILDATYATAPQSGRGTFHNMRDLPPDLTSLDINAGEYIARRENA
jgi:Formyl transferase